MSYDQAQVQGPLTFSYLAWAISTNFIVLFSLSLDLRKSAASFLLPPAVFGLRLTPGAPAV